LGRFQSRFVVFSEKNSWRPSFLIAKHRVAISTDEEQLVPRMGSNSKLWSLPTWLFDCERKTVTYHMIAQLVFANEKPWYLLLFMPPRHCFYCQKETLMLTQGKAWMESDSLDVSRRILRKTLRILEGNQCFRTTIVYRMRLTANRHSSRG